MTPDILMFENVSFENLKNKKVVIGVIVSGVRKKARPDTVRCCFLNDSSQRKGLFN